MILVLFRDFFSLGGVTIGWKRRNKQFSLQQKHLVFSETREEYRLKWKLICHVADAAKSILSIARMYFIISYCASNGFNFPSYTIVLRRILRNNFPVHNRILLYFKIVLSFLSNISSCTFVHMTKRRSARKREYVAWGQATFHTWSRAAESAKRILFSLSLQAAWYASHMGWRESRAYSRKDRTF